MFITKHEHSLETIFGILCLLMENWGWIMFKQRLNGTCKPQGKLNVPRDPVTYLTKNSKKHAKSLDLLLPIHQSTKFGESFPCKLTFGVKSFGPSSLPKLYQCIVYMQFDFNFENCHVSHIFHTKRLKAVDSAKVAMVLQQPGRDLAKLKTFSHLYPCVQLAHRWSIGFSFMG